MQNKFSFNSGSDKSSKTAFLPQNYFLDDYQHYPPKEHQQVYQKKEFFYSVSTVKKCWTSMLVEDRRVLLSEKSNPDGQTLLDANERDKSPQPTDQKSSTLKSASKVLEPASNEQQKEPPVPVKSTWFIQMIQHNHQMHGTTRDY